MSDGHDGAPVDQSARTRITDDVGTTLFVEAGAGAGKTTALVGRVLTLVERGVELRRIAAITFTERAAAELRHRIRSELGGRTEPWARAALADVDHAPIGTLHSFARRLLLDLPIEAGLPPGFTVADEVVGNLQFDDGWRDLLDRLLGTVEPAGGIVEGGRALVDLCGFDGFRLDTDLRSVAQDFRWNWDLVERHVDRFVDGRTVPELALDVSPIVAAVARLSATPCPVGDRQEDMLERIADAGRELAAAVDLATALASLRSLGSVAAAARRAGNKQNWRSIGADVLDELRAAQADLAERCDALIRTAVAHRKQVVGAIVGRFVVEAAQRRAAEGALEFHDLLVHARHLLATDGRARRRLHQLYQRVLLDEFQDTDPIQLEIAVRLTADPDDAAHEIDWTALRPIPGRLFVVGDPKQSIYRFRRADIAQYLRAADQIGATNVALSTNFRSTRAIIDVTNDVFERLIVEERDVQPAFRALVAGRAEALLDHGTVRVLGREPHLDIADGDYDGDLGRADELRRREAVDVVTTVRSALADGWPVGESTGGVHSIRPCRAGDICILLPTRLSLPALESALRDAGVPYRAENSAMVYTSAEVRAVLLALRAADDPTDELAVVSVLRTTLYGCSDVELLEWKTAGGSWSILRPAPEHLVDHPVACALEHLASLRRRSDTASAAELLTAVIDERRVLDVAFADADARDVWHRLRFVVDHARAWSDAGGHGLRRYLHWARMQGSDGRISEAILPEEDRDTVRVMTVHAAKGLEFPITVLSGMTTQPQGRNGVNVVWDGSAWMLTGRGDDGQFDEYRPIDEQMSDAERRRLLYVACTRAVDHLVVSAHRRADDASSAARRPDRLTSAELLAVVGRITDLALPATPVPTGGAVASTAPTPTAATATPDPHDAARSPATRDAVDWETSYPAVVAAATRRRAVAATRLADEVALRSTADAVVDPGLDKQPVDLSTPPWQRGRYGTAIGRAVHGTLQFCDLATGLDVEPLARSQCAAEGILGHEQHVSALVRSALAAPIVRAAAGGAAHWRELFVVAPVGDRLLEGYVDLLVRSGDGLVIVDYKTDRWSGPVQTGERLARYRLQLAAYAVALGVIVDEPVVGGVLVRCRPDGPADQIELDGWLDAQATVRSLAS